MSGIRRKTLLSGLATGIGTFVIWTVAASVAMGQGLVYFGNQVLPAPPDRLVRTPEGSPLVGTNFMAQLLYGLSECSLTVESRPAPFRPPTTSLPGTWTGGNRTLLGVSSGQTIRLKVR